MLSNFLTFLYDTDPCTPTLVNTKLLLKLMAVLVSNFMNIFHEIDHEGCITGMSGFLHTSNAMRTNFEILSPSSVEILALSKG